MTGGRHKLELHVDICKDRERGGRRKEYLTGGRHELELHVDIKIERGGKGKGKGLFDRQARIGVACRYKDRERGGKGKGKGKGYLTGRHELEIKRDALSRNIF